MDIYKKLLSYVPKERYLAYLVIFFSCVSVFFIVGAFGGFWWWGGGGGGGRRVRGPASFSSIY